MCEAPVPLKDIEAKELAPYDLIKTLELLLIKSDKFSEFSIAKESNFVVLKDLGIIDYTTTIVLMFIVSSIFREKADCHSSNVKMTICGNFFTTYFFIIFLTMYLSLEEM